MALTRDFRQTVSIYDYSLLDIEETYTPKLDQRSIGGLVSEICFNFCEPRLGVDSTAQRSVKLEESAPLCGRVPMVRN